jgi:diguanylate cyclase (GGDEF)-like protein
MSIDNKHTILLIDDEPEILSSLTRLLRKEHQVLIANSAVEGLKLMSQTEVHIILSDQRMPGMEGVEFFSLAKGKYPNAIRLLLTGYADLENVIDAINAGNIYRYLVKPWNPEELLATIRDACQKYDLIIQNNQLTKDLSLANTELEKRVKERTAELQRTNNYITALSQISSQLQLDFVYENVISTLENELIKIKIECHILRCEEDDQLGLIEKEKIPLGRIQDNTRSIECSKAILNISEFYDIVKLQKPIFVPNINKWSSGIINKLHQDIPQLFNKLNIIHPNMKGVILPLISRLRLIGILLLWGPDLIEEDLNTLSVFSNQVGIALENTILFAEVHRLAEIDGLTGIFNRRRTLEMAERELTRAKRYHHPLSVLMIDIDHFKLVNDTYGHNIGDQTLQNITKRIMGLLRDGIDILGRFGGDEFVVILPETDLKMAENIANRMRLAISQTPIETSSRPLDVTISVGISNLLDESTQLSDLINEADNAMYREKALTR